MFLRAICVGFVLLTLCAFSFLQTSSLIEDRTQLSINEIQQAKNTFKNISTQLSSDSSSFDITLTAAEVNSAAKMINYFWPQTAAHIAISDYGMLISTSSKINLSEDFFLNTRCLIAKSSAGFTEFNQCYIGSIPISGLLVKLIIHQSLKFILGNEFVKTFDIALNNVTYSEDVISTKGEKPQYLKRSVNASLYRFKEIAKMYSQTSNIDKSLIQIYLNELNLVNSNQFHDYVMPIFQLAADRSKSNDPIRENSAAIWALGVKFGSHHFSSMWTLELPSDTHSPFPQLRGRDDLTKHFVYSAVLQLIGDSNFSFSIGETKELLDSLAGGSGYSFTDLAADMAGLRFAEFITSSESNALWAQQLLSRIDDEGSFFPFTHDFPEGINQASFQRVLNSKNSQQYLNIKNEVSARIESLQLHNPYLSLNREVKLFDEKWAEPNKYGLNFSHKIDTHIHTKYSDGGYSVKQIADKAVQYGCEAIAITDHSDLNLKGVLSTEFFDDLRNAQSRYPYLTIIPGLEWNIPPFNGREHMTVLLPKSSFIKERLLNFRNQFDHFNRYEEHLLSPLAGLHWLNDLSRDETQFMPVLLYNHPSRKDFQTSENIHDFLYWREHSKLVVGFSGAPGHQKLEMDKNGAYENRHKTIDRWDPSIANVGGEWDKLLQKGVKVWAARAPSDFHNTDMDYWPCEFSSTHVKSRSSDHNDILAGLKLGNFWAQHGGFIKELDFTVVTPDQTAQIGEEVTAKVGDEILVTLEAYLADTDWGGKSTQLHQAELIIITEDEIQSKTFDLEGDMGKEFKLQHRITFTSEHVIFRWRGVNRQTTHPDYLFYTNPIRVKKRL